MSQFKEAKHEILSRLDIAAEYEKLGIQFAASKPGLSGWRACRAVGREDKNPSAAVCVESANGSLGYYKDSATGEKRSLFDMAAEYGRLGSYKAALQHFAAQTGVVLPKQSRRQRWNEKSKQVPLTQSPPPPAEKLKEIIIEACTLKARTREEYVAEWAAHKPGVSSSAALRAGATALRWHDYDVIAIGGALPESDWLACSVQLRRIDGKDFAAFKELPERRFHNLAGSKPSLILYCDEAAELGAAEFVWLAEGFTDGCASVLDSLPSDHRVTAMTHGAGTFSESMARALAGGKGRVAVCLNADSAGQRGADGAIRLLQAAGAQVWKVQLPPGPWKDLRDYSAAGGAVEPLLQQLDGPPIEPLAADQPAKESGLTHDLAELICREAHFAIDDGGMLHRYAEGVYQPTGRPFIERRVKALLNQLGDTESWTSKLASEVVKYISTDAPLLPQQPPAGKLNLLNGILDLATRELLPHSPGHLSTVQIPVAYDPAATCPKIDAFVSQVFPEDAVPLAWEIPGFCMSADRSIQKCVLLIGKGGNGKSTWLNLLRRFLGKSNTTSTSLHCLEKERFARVSLVGKLACISADLPSAHLESTSVFKGITGGDEITMEYKHINSFDYTPFAKLVFSCNAPPVARDRSEGFFDRWLVVPFTRKFRGTEVERGMDELLDELATPAELSGMLNRALEALACLKGRRRFTESASVSQGMAQLVCASDPLAAFLNERTEQGDYLSPKSTILKFFNEYLAAMDRRPFTAEKLSLQLKKYCPSVDSTKCKYGDAMRVQCFRGIRMRECPENKHRWVDQTTKKIIRTECANCGKWLGNRPVEND